jgi:PelA/Pel-15E family pectate lyase
MHSITSLLFMLVALISIPCDAQEGIDISGFQDGSHHWYDIEDEDKVITALPDQPRYTPTYVRGIADNILLYQKSNGGWPKNYDMLAILTADQKRLIDSVKNDTNTTFDNGATHSQVEFLASAYQKTDDQRYRDACLRGIDFILAAQYENGGWPQFYPDTSGYRKYITFNDGAMIGVMRVLHDILRNQSQYSFITGERREQVERAFDGGLDCILKCQVVQNGILTVWGEQHDNVDYHPQDARTFEPASLSGRESAEIALFLMSIGRPSKRVISAVNAAVHWISRSKILGVKVEEFKASVAHFKYRTVDYDRKVVNDPNAPPIWARLYEFNTNRPLFCNRDGKPVFSLAEVERERRTGYSWYVYEPAGVLDKYPAWQKKWSPDEDALAN